MMVKKHFDPRTARMLMTVAKHPIISNRNHGSVLPPSWRTLYELTKLSNRPAGTITVSLIMRPPA
jgi:hypothetical protein